MNRLACTAFLSIAGLFRAAAQEVPATVQELPGTIQVQLASAAGGEPLTDTSVVTRDGRKTYIAHYRNRATGELQTIRVAENGTVEANEPRRPPVPARADAKPSAEPPVAHQPPASGPGPSAEPRKAEPSKKKVADARPGAKDEPPAKSAGERGGRGGGADGRPADDADADRAEEGRPGGR